MGILKKIITGIMIISLSLCFPSIGLCKTVKTGLTIYDTTSRDWNNLSEYDSLVSTGYFKARATSMKKTVMADFSTQDCCDITKVSQVKNKIKETFKKTNSKSINIIYIAAHGSGVSFQPGCGDNNKTIKYLTIDGIQIRRWCDKYVKGKTVIITSQCEGGHFAKEFYYGKNVKYAKKHYCIMTAVNKTDSYAYSDVHWSYIRDTPWNAQNVYHHASAADTNADGKVSVKEWFRYNRDIIYRTNLLYAKSYGGVDRGVLYGDKVSSVCLFKYK